MNRRKFLISTSATVALSSTALAVGSKDDFYTPFKTEKIEDTPEYCIKWIETHYGFPLSHWQKNAVYALYENDVIRIASIRRSGKTVVIHGYLLFKQVMIRDKAVRYLVLENIASAEFNANLYDTRLKRAAFDYMYRSVYRDSGTYENVWQSTVQGPYSTRFLKWDPNNYTLQINDENIKNTQVIFDMNYVFSEEEPIGFSQREKMNILHMTYYME